MTCNHHRLTKKCTICEGEEVTDIVERLRNSDMKEALIRCSLTIEYSRDIRKLHIEAANEIEQLREKVEQQSKMIANGILGITSLNEEIARLREIG